MGVPGAGQRGPTRLSKRKWLLIPCIRREWPLVVEKKKNGDKMMILFAKIVGRFVILHSAHNLSVEAGFLFGLIVLY
jgi:hypothetical protein